MREHTVEVQQLVQRKVPGAIGVEDPQNAIHQRVEHQRWQQPQLLPDDDAVIINIDLTQQMLDAPNLPLGQKCYLSEYAKQVRATDGRSRASDALPAARRARGIE